MSNPSQTETVIAPRLQPNDVVRLTNLGVIPWEGKHASQTYRMEPGGEIIVPFFAACRWFGHPDAVDLNPRERYRSDEHNRLRVFYGAYGKPLVWGVNTPKIEVHTLDGEKIVTVIEDPEGGALTPAQTTVAERDQLRAQMDSMTRQMKMLQAQLDQQNRTLAAEDQGDLVDDDVAPPSLGGNPAAVPSPEGGDTVQTPDTPLATDEAEASVEVSEDAPTRTRVSST